MEVEEAMEVDGRQEGGGQRQYRTVDVEGGIEIEGRQGSGRRR